MARSPEVERRHRAIAQTALDPVWLGARLQEQRARAIFPWTKRKIDESINFVGSGQMEAGIQAALAARQKTN